MVNSKNSPKRGRIRGRAQSIRKKTSRGKERTKSTEVVYHSTKEIKVERALIENFIGLQKVMINLSAKFDNLSSQISNLLQLFEISAKALARKEVSSPEHIDSKKVMEKIDRLSEQAGLIGKGLALIHEVATEEGKPIPFNIPVKPRPALPMPFPANSMQPSILGSEPRMIREIIPERPEVKKMTAGSNENVA